jgi:hypothetical protein
MSRLVLATQIDTQANYNRHSTARQPQAAEVSFSSDHHATAASDSFATGDFLGGYEDFTLMFDDPTFDFSVDDYMPFDPLNFNTKPDNFRQCVQNSSTSSDRANMTSGTPHDWYIPDMNAKGGFPSRPQNLETGNNAIDLMIPHSSQISNDYESLHRGDLSQSQSDSALRSDARIASAGQLDAHGIQATTNASSNSGDPGVFTQLTHTPHAYEPNNSLQVDSDRGGSPSDGDPGAIRGGQDDVPLLIGGGQGLADTALRHSRRPAMSVLRSAAGTSPQSNVRRHRTRSDGVYDPSLQSELSLTSATNSSTGSNTEHTATLDGRLTVLGGTPVSPQLSSRGGRVDTQLGESARPTMLSPTTSPGSALAEGANAPLSSPSLSSRSSTVPTSTRISASPPLQQSRAPSALFAHPSQFDRVAGTHARSTELFRAKHRIPASLDTSAPATGFVPSAANLSAQANGGAYPRLRSTAIASSSNATGLATQQQVRTSQPTPSTTNTSKATEASGARMLFTESDTRRYRDHHGRTAAMEDNASIASRSVASAFARIAMAILALGTLLMATSAFAHPSFLLLAILAPVSVVFADRTAASSSLISRARGAFASKRAEHQHQLSLSLARFGLRRPLGCV